MQAWTSRNAVRAGIWLASMIAITAVGASLQFALSQTTPPTDFRAYNANGTTQDWVSTSNDCWTGIFTLTLPEGNWAIFMDEDMMPPRVELFTNGTGIIHGIGWNRISPIYTGPGVITVTQAVHKTGPWFFRLHKL